MIDLFLDNIELVLGADGDAKRVREVILQLAVRGRLVGQDANSTVEALGSLVEVHGGATPSTGKAEYWGAGTPWVSPKDMKSTVIESTQDEVTDRALNETRLRIVPPGTVLVVIRGMILVHSFPVATTAIPVTINQDLKALRPRETVDHRWLVTALSGLKQEVLGLVLRSTHGTCKLPIDTLLGIQLRVPPLAEQHRIVAKVDELMTLCDELETRLARAKSLRERFAESVMQVVTDEPITDATELRLTQPN